MIADIRPLLPPGSKDTDVDFCQKLTKDVGVTLIPVSALYVSDDPPKHLVRICFCKSMPKLEKACNLMEAHFRQRVAA
jgi:N-succinyldiaminopimelate aminotransferase